MVRTQYYPWRTLPVHINQPFNKPLENEDITNWNLYKGPELRNELQKRYLSPKGEKGVLVRRLQNSDRQDREVERDNPLWWRFRTVGQLKGELKHRGLSVQGIKEVLTRRLEVSDRLAREAKENGAEVSEPAFPRFSKLPIEIRWMIWRLTFPQGPRAITVDIDDKKLLFCPINHRCANPIALSICSESRELSLKTYSTVLGWKDVYADFENGDYLYFGNWCNVHSEHSNTDRFHFRHRPDPDSA